MVRHEEVDSFFCQWSVILNVGSGVRVGEGFIRIGGRESDDRRRTADTRDWEYLRKHDKVQEEGVGNEA